jgi:hypothetical protein
MSIITLNPGNPTSSRTGLSGGDDTPPLASPPSSLLLPKARAAAMTA